MALWKESEKSSSPSSSSSDTSPDTSGATRLGASDFAETPAPAKSSAPVAAAEPAGAKSAGAKSASESHIAPDLVIEGKIEGAGHVRIAGRFKGDINVRGDLTIEHGAEVEGGVRAERVTVAGDLTGNIETAAYVELLETGALTGDVKSKTFSVAKGSKMRGQAEFGWDDDKGAKGAVTGIHKSHSGNSDNGLDK